MKESPALLPFACALAGAIISLSGLPGVAGEVEVTKTDEAIRFEIDGKLFTEWRIADWDVPYLYPVIGPHGVNVTRHYPMKEGVEHEQTDHPHHRSIRFSHRGINGYSFWAPHPTREGGDAKIVLDRVESMTSGKTGEVVMHNRWLGGGELVLEERLRLAVTPLPDGEVLLDYDTTLTANGGTDAHFVDQKDGGLGVRVAGTMKVSDRETGEGDGVIVNSHGDRDEAAWGKRAEWADYSGPDPSGEIAGIAIFDHPDNLRFPTHWHARTYGLITANRFGTGYFEAKSGAKVGDGDYVLEAGETMTLKHRIYIHRGDAESAKVAERYRAYAGK